MSKQTYIICIFLWMFCTLTWTQTSDLSDKDLNLLRVIIMFRHGARAPLRTFKFDTYTEADEVLWPEGSGNLINEGKNQMYELGKRLRERYENLLIPYANSVAEDVQMVTTAVHRCYQSGALVLSGFYPPNERQIWNKEISWLPVPIRSLSPDKTHIAHANKESCPSYRKEIMAVMNVIRNKKDYKANYEYLADFLANFTDSGMKNVTDLENLYWLVGDYMHIKIFLNLKLPDWVTDDFLTKVFKFQFELANSLTYTSKLRELLIGPLINDIIHRIQDVTISSHNGNSKFYFYSGHDISLMALLDECNLKRDFIPSYGASFIFEIFRSSSNNYFVRILFSKDYTLNSISVKILPSCSEYCPVNKFIEIFEKYLTQDWDKECNS